MYIIMKQPLPNPNPNGDQPNIQPALTEVNADEGYRLTFRGDLLRDDINEVRQALSRIGQAVMDHVTPDCDRLSIYDPSPSQSEGDFAPINWEPLKQGLSRFKYNFKGIMLGYDDSENDRGVVGEFVAGAVFAKEVGVISGRMAKQIGVMSVDAVANAYNATPDKVKRTVAAGLIGGTSLLALDHAAQQILQPSIDSVANLEHQSPKTSKAETAVMQRLSSIGSSTYVVKVDKDTHLSAIAARVGQTVEQLEHVNGEYVGGKVIEAGQRVTVLEGIGTYVDANEVNGKNIKQVANKFNLPKYLVEGANTDVAEPQNIPEGKIFVPGHIVVNLDNAIDKSQLNDIARSVGAAPLNVRTANRNTDTNVLSIPVTGDLQNKVALNSETAIKQLAQGIGNYLVAAPTVPAAEAPTTTTAVVETTTTAAPTTEAPTTEAPTTTAAPAPEVPKTPEIPVQIQNLNKALAEIDFSKEVYDLDNVVKAVKELDAWYAPNDPDRIQGLPVPAGYVKMLLPNEAPGVDQLRVPAERTTSQERYTLPETEATIRALAAYMDKLIQTKYPQYADVHIRLRDAASPMHMTHNYGYMLDFSTQRGLDVKRFSDGPMSDFVYSKVDPNFATDMYLAISRMQVDGKRVVDYIYTSNEKMVARVNAQVKKRLMSYDKEGGHREHDHIAVSTEFALNSKKNPLPFRENMIPLDEDRDAHLTSPNLTPAERDTLHHGYLTWLAANNKDQPAPAPAPVAPAPAPTPAPSPEAKAPAETYTINLPEATKTFMNKAVPEALKLKDLYQQTEKATGVPWEIIAAIHYREGNNNPKQSVWNGQAVGSVNIDNGRINGRTIEEDAIKAANHAKGMVKAVYGIKSIDRNMTIDQLEKIFVAYNRGAMYKNAGVDAGKSPYASNGLDGRENMHFPSGVAEPKSTRGDLDRRPGAIAMLAALGYQIAK